MPGGRPTKPTHLKVLHGDDKKNPQRINRAEPVPDGEIRPPWELTDEAQAHWDRLAPDRIAKGVLQAWDCEAFALFCEALVQAEKGAREAGKPSKPGAPSPMSRMKDAVAILTTLGGRFGWTPSDRAKLVAPREGSNPKERLLS